MFNLTILEVIIRATAPILLAGIGCLYCERAGVTNIILEGAMLIGAFFGVVGSYFLHSATAGVLCAVLASVILSVIFAIITIKLGGDELVVGFAINVLVTGLTIYLLKQIFGQSGSFVSSDIIGISKITIPILGQIPILKYIFSNQTWIVYFAFINVLLAHLIIYRSSFGMNILASGENPQAAAVVGTNVYKVRFICILITGVLCGLAGAQISLGFLSMFSENMTAGRGFIALAAVIFSRGKPQRVLFITLLFGLAEAISNQMQLLQLPSELILMIPYITVIIMTLFKPRDKRKSKSLNLQ